jgi:hypothetical protein
MTQAITSPSNAAATISAALTVPSTRPAKAAAAGLALAQPGRDQRRIQRAFRQQSPDDIDELECGQKRIRDGTRAEQRRDHGVAEKSKQPRGQRARGYREEGADHRGFYSSVACDRPQTFANRRKQDWMQWT